MENPRMEFPVQQHPPSDSYSTDFNCILLMSNEKAWILCKISPHWTPCAPQLSDYQSGCM